MSGRVSGAGGLPRVRGMRGTGKGAGRECVWRGGVARFGGYRGCMDYLKGPLYLDIAAKGLCFVGVVMMIFGQGGWFIGGVIAVVLGVVCGALSMVAGRRMRQRGWGGANRVE